MLFIFPSIGNYSFWMKDTKISLDIIWIDQNMKIVHVENNVPSCQKDPCPVYDPSADAQFVLEISANTFNRLNLQLGNTADISLSK